MRGWVVTWAVEMMAVGWVVTWEVEVVAVAVMAVETVAMMAE